MFDLRPPRLWAIVGTVQRVKCPGPMVETVEDVVGVATYNFRFNGATLKRIVCLQAWYVLPEHRNKGLGTAMWKAVTQEGLKHRCDLLEAELHRDNERAAALYAKQGAKNVTQAEGWKQFFIALGD